MGRTTRDGLAVSPRSICDGLDQRPREEDRRAQAGPDVPGGFDAHLRDACLRRVSEIFDAESPHRPRGCVAQAWSIAEPLRALIEDLGFQADLLQPALKRVALRSRTTSIPRSMPGKRGPGMRPVSGKETRPTP